MTEEFQAQKLVRWLNTQRIEFIHVPNEGKRGYKAQQSMRRLGLKTGATDYILILFFGKTIWLELKADHTKKLTKDQQRFRAKLLARGHVHITGYDAKDSETKIRAALQDLGLELLFPVVRVE